MDFNVNGDKIDLSAFKDSGGNALDFTDVPDSDTSDGNYSIDLSDFGGGTITILGVTTGLDGTDFIF